MTQEATNGAARFEVNTEGMRQLHRNREPYQLVKELVQNVFDEEVTVCRVEIIPEIEGTRVTVEDDGPGFRDVRDAYTLMGDTPKRLDPERRGRFNMGEKEIISVAVSAEVKTAGHTVEFPAEGGRRVAANRRKRGTRVSLLMPWDREKSAELAERLTHFRPPEGIAMTVNGVPVSRAPELRVHQAVLETVIQDAPGEPMRPTRRKTAMHVLAPNRDGQAWILEMGIPIQPVDMIYSVDVMQKVPMPPNRDTVSENYLKRIYAETLNAMNDEMPDREFSEQWVRSGMEHRAIEKESVERVIQKRYGDRVVSWSSNPDSNMRAIDAGYEVIHPRSASREEMKNMRDLGGLQSANQLFPRQPSTELDLTPIPLHTLETDFIRWVQETAALAGKKVTTRFVNDPRTDVAACCTMNTQNPEMLLNRYHLDDEFLRGRGARQLELVIHELGHADSDGRMSHGPEWGEGCCRVAGLIAAGLNRK